MNRSCVIRVALAWAVTVALGAASPSVGDEPFFMGLGHLPGGYPCSRAKGVSADGQVVVGFGASASWQTFEAFRWTAEQGMVGLGHIPGGDFGSVASGVSADGSVIVGGSGAEAFRWTPDEGMVGLGDLPGGGFRSYGYAVSADGYVVVGRGTSDLGPEAFRWTAEEGMIGLGDIPGGFFQSIAYGVSGDGSVVVGKGAAVEPEIVASIWLAGDNQMYDLGHWLMDNFALDLTGWELSSAYGISADGCTIVGSGRNPLGQVEAWIAHIPEPSTLWLLAVGVLAFGRRKRRWAGRSGDGLAGQAVRGRR